ncbi:tetratricopeptide repeat protein, partial [Candidatus Babeliales bacterium]|nr:tetratricopeptide repeat protein [Candidatus Babeliales bacterium]
HKVIDTLETLNKQHPQSQIIVSALADLNLAEGNDKHALKAYKKLATLIKNGSTLQAKTLHQIGFAQYRLGNIKEAIDSLKKALEHNPDFNAANNMLAYLYAQEGTNLETALELVEKTLKGTPQNTAFLDTKATILIKLNRNRDALVTVKQALQLDPLSSALRKRAAELKSMALTAATQQ